MGERHIYFTWLEANADQTEYTLYNPYTKTDMEWVCEYPECEVKLVKLWFGSGTGGWTFIRVLHNRTVIAPREGKGFGLDGFTTDDDSMPIYLNRKMVKGERLSFEYKNLDAAGHKAFIQFEVEPIRHKDSDGFEGHAIPNDIPGTTTFVKKQKDSTVSQLEKDTGGW